ncbi:DRTGG domain-containing protein [Anaerovirgula multivorans]|uniref:DRTGG domain-containing protein n=1 Tax=Anaerovirgula multivorans TaxID=312168 RepID=A0A239DVI5_9FIRM|nr:DRTGG domain-containing protein [Anaerovirgula multivorans]SNS35634.1 DRTGG domain-containing protein [Anaerovirgula multivorans]
MLTVEQLKNELLLEVAAGQNNMSNIIKGVYIGDLLSWVMAHIKKEDVWITIQTNMNVIAVAALGEASCIIVAENAEIEEATLLKADEEGIPLLVSPLSAYEIAVKINKYLQI